MDNLTISRAQELLNKSKGMQIAVIGDVMLDRYFWGSVSRISPESPVPVVDLESESFHLGGAANVANNLKSLGINPLLCGMIGNDNSGRSFVDIANELGINTGGLYQSAGRPTTVKTRIIGNNQHIARLDRETRDPLDERGEEYILNILASDGILAGIIFEDYNKGTITRSLIQKVINFAKPNKIPVFVDPKFDNFYEYQGVTVFKPNRKEAQQALNNPMKTNDDIIIAGNTLLKKIGCDNVLLTLGRDGMMLFESNGNISSVPTRARNVADVSGAGDTAIATLAAAIAGGANIREASALANFASGVVCEAPGIVSITVESLLSAVYYNQSRM